MDNNTLIEKNIELSFEFTKYLFDHPELEEKIPKEAQVVFLPEYDKKLKEYNIKIAKKCLKKKHPVVYVKIKKLAPLTRSRLIETEIKLAS